MGEVLQWGCLGQDICRTTPGMEQGQDIMGQMADELSTVFCMIQFGTVFQLVLHPIITIYTIDLYGPVWSVGVVWSVGAL